MGSAEQNVSNKRHLIAPPWFVLINGVYTVLILTWEQT